MTLSKSDSRQRWRELCEIVNRWDPIGVFGPQSTWPQDEYECVVGPLMRMLEEGKPRDAIAGYLEREVRGHFGLDPVPGEAEKCAAEAVTWYARAWPGTRA